MRMIYYFISILIGALAVIQGGLNRQMAKSVGLSSALLINSIFVLIFAYIFWLVAAKSVHLFQESMAPRGSLVSDFKWWYLIPSVCGFLLILGIPSIIPKLGAQSVFLCIVVGQMIFSLIWDLTFEGKSIDAMRITGVVIALIGLLISSWKSLF